MTQLDDLYVGLHTLTMAGPAILCFDWSDLLADAPKRGEDTVIPELHGREPYPRMRDEGRVALDVRISGEWTGGGARLPATDYSRTAWVMMFYAHLQTLRAVTDRTGLTEVKLTRPGGIVTTAQAFIEDGGTPEFLNPWTAELTIDLTLPDGRFPLVP